MYLRDKVAGKVRVFLSASSDGMTRAVRIDEDMYGEVAYGSATLIHILCERILDPAGRLSQHQNCNQIISGRQKSRALPSNGGRGSFVLLSVIINIETITPLGSLHSFGMRRGRFCFYPKIRMEENPMKYKTPRTSRALPINSSITSKMFSAGIAPTSASAWAAGVRSASLRTLSATPSPTGVLPGNGGISHAGGNKITDCPRKGNQYRGLYPLPRAEQCQTHRQRLLPQRPRFAEIGNGLWNWHSHGIGGKNVVDYLIKVRGYSFVDAVRHLAGEDYSH
jgi:hypothetical protein